ncbi:MAG: hypothetical protein U0359_32460 [Byssovorax sp.]
MSRALRSAALRGLFFAGLLAQSACGTPLIAGECADGYTLVDGACVAVCKEGLERRDGYCRPDGGEVVVLGLEFADAQPGDSVSHVLGNAVFMSDHHPVRVLDYHAHSAYNASSVTSAVYTIANEAVARQRTITAHVAEDDDDVVQHLDTTQTDVLLIHDEDEAAPGELAGLGAAWAPALRRFLQQRGLVIVLASASGTNEMGELLGAAGLFHVTKVAPVVGQPLELVSEDDVLAEGLPDQVPMTRVCASFALDPASNPDASAVLATAAGTPVVMRRSFKADVP